MRKDALGVSQRAVNTEPAGSRNCSLLRNYLEFQLYNPKELSKHTLEHRSKETTDEVVLGHYLALTFPRTR